ncbi:uncharacterized protein LOC109860317 [Pseudomyrmex gracilis]|uniref:uncharacterized protein LOC109860317 n=1 Tax=Pseudomyrmex gracilis TaxID=219809 RepID=UPI00099584EE|nr:uncharacterized protein LOC109860317 [Pseudomyrmex gracilis]
MYVARNRRASVRFSCQFPFACRYKMTLRSLSPSFGNKITKPLANESENSNECEKQVLLMKSTFDPKLFPDDFDTWTTKEQYKWINGNLRKFYPNMPETLLGHVTAIFRQIKFDRSPVETPEWLDIEKYRRGQKLVRENVSAITVSKLISIVHVYCFIDALKPIIIGGNSHTLQLGFKRYLSTMRRISSWYFGEPWVKGTQAYKDMQIANKYHLLMRNKLCQLDNEQIDAAATLAELRCSDHEMLLKDFAAACPFEKPGQCIFPLDNSPYKPKGINNTDIAVTQASFVSMIVLRPQDLGVHNATDEDIEAFCHMWRCYGYYLGLEDEYNFCRGNLAEIKQRLRDYNEYWVKPCLKNATVEWEHMTKCLIEPMNFYPYVYMPYKSMLLIAMDLLDLNMTRLYASLSYSEWIAYKIYKFILKYGLKVSIVREVFNKFIIGILHETKFN